MRKYIICFVSALLIFAIYSTGSSASRVTLEQAVKSGNGRYPLSNAAISINKIPDTVEEFVSLRDKIAENPMGGYAIFVIAMIKYSQNKELGIKFFTIAMDRSILIQSSSGVNYRGFKPNSRAMYFIKQMNLNPYLGNIYITGTDYRNAYALPNPPHIIKFNQATINGADSIKLFAFTTSGNSPRPITLKRNNRGIWKAYEFSSMFVGISRLPAKKQIDDDL